MNELTKIKRSVTKQLPEAPDEVMLILDGSVGQNAFIQAQEFTKATDVSCLTITKLDGTAKGGIVLAIAKQLGLPIRFIGIGEAADDFGEFDAAAFAAALIDGE